MKKGFPKPTGEYKVGTKIFTVKTGLQEQLEGHVGEARDLPCRIWYPADEKDVAGRKKSEYLSRELAKAYGQNYDKAMANGDNLSECYVDANHAEGKFPLVVYNHGYQAFMEANSCLCLDLASHGYVVLSLGHPYESKVLTYAEGKVIKEDKKITSQCTKPELLAVLASVKLEKKQGSNEELQHDFLEFQNKYSSFMVGRVDAWSEETEAARKYVQEHFADMIDLEAGVGITGHSLGGAVAHNLCRKTTSYKCGMNMDGGLFGDYDSYVMKTPFMNLICDKHAWVIAGAYLNNDAQLYTVTFQKMMHLGFTDMKFVLPISVGKLPGEVVHRNLCACHQAFFDKYLKGKDTEPKSLDEGVSVRKVC